MPVISFIARRYLSSRRNRGFISFITLIGIAGIALGVAALIITLSILDGFEKTIKGNVVSFTAHMEIFGFSGLPLQNPDRARARIVSSYPEVQAMAPYVAREGMIRSDADIEGILVKGVDPSSDVSAARRIVAGEYKLSDNPQDRTVILGRQLSERLQVGVGDTVIIFGLGGLTLTLSETRVMQFTVAGLYETGMAEYDATYAYVNLRNAQELFRLGTAVTGFDVMVKNLDDLPTLVQEIPSDLGYPYYARSMFQMYRNLFTWIDLQKETIPIILGLIIVVAAFNVIGTLLMMVMEKTKDIGVLKTLGADRKTIRRVFLFQGMVIGVVGTVLGNALGYGLAVIEQRYSLISLPSEIYFMTRVPIDLSVTHFLLVSVIALLMSFLCSYIPARLASRMDPIRLIRFL